MIYFEAQNNPAIFNTPLKVVQIDMYIKTDVKPVEIFWENDQRPEFLLIWEPKGPKNWASEAHILHTSKSTCNAHVKQYWCETSENFLRKWPNTRIFTYFGAQNGPEIGSMRPILYTSLKVAPMSI